MAKKIKRAAMKASTMEAVDVSATWDSEVNAMYIYITSPIAIGKIKKTTELSGPVIADYDKNGNLLGLEILGVHLRPAV